MFRSEDTKLTEVISVKFKNRGKVYFFDPHGIAVRTGDKVVVETSRGLELARKVTVMIFFQMQRYTFSTN